MLDGGSWGELMDPLIHVDWFYAAIFLAFGLFSALALLNTVTGAFVNAAIEKSALEREALCEHEIHRRKACVEHLKQIFIESDEEETGQITMAQFDTHMTDPKVEPYIAALNIDTSNISELFHLLDKDNSGRICLHEFVANIIELMHHSTGGTEKQVRKLVHEQHRMRHTLKHFMAFVQEELQAIRQTTCK